MSETTNSRENDTYEDFSRLLARHYGPEQTRQILTDRLKEMEAGNIHRAPTLARGLNQCLCEREGDHVLVARGPDVELAVVTSRRFVGGSGEETAMNGRDQRWSDRFCIGFVRRKEDCMATTRYLIACYGGASIELEGPFENDEAQLQRARAIYQESDENAVQALDIVDGVPEMSYYTNGDLDPDPQDYEWTTGESAREEEEE